MSANNFVTTCWVVMLITDHAPLQWLSAQKMEGMLCRWALAMQEYNFTIKYRKGSLNGNADALSRCSVVNPCATVLASSDQLPDLLAAQKADNLISQLFQARLQSDSPPQESHRWCQQPLQRYRQLWHQLKIVDGILCRQYSPVTCSDVVTVPILPERLQQQAIYQSHNLPIAGHQGYKTTLERLRQSAYWVNMAKDVLSYCRSCEKCQQSKLALPQ